MKGHDWLRRRAGWRTRRPRKWALLFTSSRRPPSVTRGYAEDIGESSPATLTSRGWEDYVEFCHISEEVNML